MKTILTALMLSIAVLSGCGQAAHATPTPAVRHVYPVLHTKPRISSHVVKLSSIVHGISAGDGDLTAWAPVVRNQQSNGSCLTFASTTVRAWIAYHDQGVQFDAYGLSPMFQYSQLVTDPSQGTSFEDNLNIEERQGAEPSAQYSYGEQNALTDWHDQPTAADIARAAPWKISNYSAIYNSADPQSEQADPVAIIEQALHDGYPVLLGLAVYDDFMFYTGQGEVQPTGSNLYGYHAIAGFKANTDGSVDIENSWGTGWGKSGWATLSPTFIRADVFAVYIVFGPHAAPTPTPAPIPTDTPLPTQTPAPTATPRPNPTNTPTITSTSTPVPTTTSTSTPTAVPTPTHTATPTPTPKPHKHHKRKHRGPRGGYHGNTWL